MNAPPVEMSMNKTKTPIKRQKSLQSLSREHHHNLLLCWKLRTGFLKGVETERMKKYVDWFYQNHVVSHFKLEEDYIFPVLGNAHVLIKKANMEHRRLKRLFENSTEIKKSLNRIEEELQSHIRFEERILFAEIQKVATKEQLQIIEENHTEEKFVDNTEDEFWK